MKLSSFIIVLISILIFNSCTKSPIDTTEKSYCGTVEYIGYEGPTSGHKSHTNPTYYLIIKDTQCKKNIRVNVNVPTYYDAIPGKVMCFTLSGFDLWRYGNTNGKHLK